MVQEKAIACPVDSLMYHKARVLLVKEARERNSIATKDSEEISRMFENLKLPVILGTDVFIDWVKNSFFEDKVHEQVPDSGYLSPEAEKIRSVVCQRYRVAAASLMQLKRGVSNEPRNVATYLTRILRKDRLLAISSAFGMCGYSSASSAIERVSERLSTDEGFRNRLTEIKQVIINQKGQAET